jgi:Rieske Fe-S protein
MTDDLLPSCSRRAVLFGSGAVGAVALASACGSSSSASHPTKQADAAESTSAAASSGPLRVSEVPIGGGTVLTDQDTVITQPQAGQFKAFSATCTHLGCQVEGVSNGTINCPCHGSRYNITDGSVARGPATKALPPKTLVINGDTLTVS